MQEAQLGSEVLKSLRYPWSCLHVAYGSVGRQTWTTDHNASDARSTHREKHLGCNMSHGRRRLLSAVLKDSFKNAGGAGNGVWLVQQAQEEGWGSSPLASNCSVRSRANMTGTKIMTKFRISLLLNRISTFKSSYTKSTLQVSKGTQRRKEAKSY